MARGKPITTDTQVRALKTPGRYGLGGTNRNLYLIVDRALNRRWVFRFTFDGVERDMGLGSYLSVPLAAATKQAEKLRAQVAEGKNPIELKAAEKAVPTFGAVAEEYLAGGDKRWKNAKHAYQWRRTLEVDAKAIWVKRVDRISQHDVFEVLKAMWNTRRETASRLRGRIETILDLKAARVHRTGSNPAEWKVLKKDLEEIADNAAGVTSHFAAMPWADVPAFMIDLRAREATAALALEFTVLCAARSGETLGARWSE